MKVLMIVAVVVLLALIALGGYAKVRSDEAQQAAAAAAAAAASQQAQEEAEAAARAQEEAEAAAAAAEAAQREAEAASAARLARDSVQEGDRIGRIWIADTKVDCDLYWGDTPDIFRRGAGVHNADACVLPGAAGTVFIGAHTDTYFRDLESVEIGDIIHLETDWGNYDYTVTDMKRITETDVDQCRWGDTEPNCILYTCYPFGIQTRTIYRWLVYAEPVETQD